MNIAKNSLWLLLARTGTQVMGALFTILLARRLGSAGFGEYAFIAAVIFVGNMLTTFGTDMSLIREIAGGGQIAGLSAALLIQLVLSALFIAITWLAAPFIPGQSGDAIRALQIYSLVVIPLAFFTVVTSVLRAKQYMNAYAWLNLAGSALQLTLAWFCFHEGGSLVSLAYLLLLHQTVVALIGAVTCQLRIPGFWSHWRFARGDILRLLQRSAPLALLAVIGVAYQRLSVILLSFLGGPVMTGWFSAAQRTVEAAKTGHSAVFTALYPAMAARRTTAFHFAWILLLAAAGAAALSLSVLARPLTRLLFGVEYEASVPVLRILAWILVPYTVSTFMTLRLVALHQEQTVLRASLAGLVVLGGLSVWWIPRAGLAGATSSALVAEAVLAGLLLIRRRVA